MTHYYGHTGYTTPNGEALCIECAGERYTDDQLAGSTPVSEAGETLGAIFISSKWDYAPSCDDCNEIIECTVICVGRDIEHPTLTLNDDGETVEVESPDEPWTEYDMRGYLDQTECDCCGLMVQYAHVSPDGGKPTARIASISPNHPTAIKGRAVNLPYQNYNHKGVTTMTTVQELAHEMSTAFERRTRDNGDTFVALKDGSPQWMTDVCHEAHGDMLPDDWRYSFIEEVADALAENEDTDYAQSQATEPDIYTGRLTTWLNSRTDRYAYCDAAVEEYGQTDNAGGILSLLQMGQAYEKDEVFGLVLSALEALADEDEENEEEDAG